jgi:hypothetical protein
MRVYNEVYCDARCEREVEVFMEELVARLKKEKPEWEFDFGGGWENADDEEG